MLFCTLLDMYSTKLKKHDSQKLFLDKKFLSEDNEPLSDEAIFYSRIKKLTPRAYPTRG